MKNIDEIKQNLKSVIEKEINKKYYTGEINIREMATDCLEAIEQLEEMLYENYENEIS